MTEHPSGASSAVAANPDPTSSDNSRSLWEAVPGKPVRPEFAPAGAS